MAAALLTVDHVACRQRFFCSRSVIRDCSTNAWFQARMGCTFFALNMAADTEEALLPLAQDVEGFEGALLCCCLVVAVVVIAAAAVAAMSRRRSARFVVCLVFFVGAVLEAV